MTPFLSTTFVISLKFLPLASLVLFIVTIHLTGLGAETTAMVAMELGFLPKLTH